MPPGLRILSHPQQGCRVDGMNSSTLPPHSLITLPEESDGTTEFDIWTHHKFGGNPTLEAIGTLDDSTRSDLAKGDFQFVCQLAFPDVNDAGVDANWPVCDCLFQLYRGNQTGRTRYAAVWDKL